MIQMVIDQSLQKNHKSVNKDSQLPQILYKCTLYLTKYSFSPFQIFTNKIVQAFHVAAVFLILIDTGC